MNTRYLALLLAAWLGGSGDVLAASRWDQPTPLLRQSSEQALAKPVDMTVYRSPSCGCCGKWLDHVRQQGFQVTDVLSEDMNAVKKRLGVPANLASCHTAVVGGYVVEGHVPAGDIKKLLTEKPPLAGIAAPGMPQGSPGMEMGGRQDAFAVKSFDKDGKTATFNEYPAQ